MRILIDIGHPAHVHYFKNFIKIMESKGHTFFVSARDRSIIFKLLEKFKIPYYNRGKGRDGVLGKLFYMLAADIKLVIKALKFKPTIAVSFASPYAAQTAWLLGIPSIVLDDTEHARFGHFLYKPFSTTFLNPDCFQKDFGKKQIRINSYFELLYLHHKYFRPNSDIRNILGIGENEKFVLLRFVSWKASHDIGQSGLNPKIKTDLINILIDRGYKVYISSEGDLDDQIIEKFKIRILPEQMHDVLAKASLLITEGATMASECAMLGTPAIYVNSLDAGTLREQEDKYKLIAGFRSSEGVKDKVVELICSQELSLTNMTRCKNMLSEKIDPTEFLVWFIEKYPESRKIMMENHAYQYRFR